MAALSLTATVYVGCILDRGAELTEDPASSTGGNTGTGGLGGFGNMGGTTTQGGDGGVPTGGGGTGGMPTGGGGSGGVLNGGGGSGGEPMPTDVNDCILWLRADLGAPTTGDVALWENQCGAPGDDATQTNPAWRPEAMATGGPSMMPAMAFDPATSDHMNLTLTSTSSDYTLFAVLNQQSAAATQALITTDDTAGAYYHFTAVDPPGNGNFVAVNQGTTNYECIGAVTGEQWLSWRLDSVAQTFTCARHDGNSATITNWTGPWSWSTSPFLGSSKPGNNNLDALLSEVILYERALTSNEMQLVEAYLMNRYGAL